jgi:hypothetical protein
VVTRFNRKSYVIHVLHQQLIYFVEKKETHNLVIKTHWETPRERSRRTNEVNVNGS